MSSAHREPLRWRVVELDRLREPELADWHALRSQHPETRSPFFDPAFAQAVHDSGRRVVVAMAETMGGDCALMWALERRRGRLRPVGWPAADYQGPVGSAGFDATDMLRAARSHTLSFDHLVPSATSLAGQVSTWRPSPHLDVSGGMTGYLTRASKSGRSNLSQARRRVRKAEERYGPLRFVATADDPALLDEVIELKRGQYAATGARDYFSEPGRVDLLHRLSDVREPGCTGVLSGLWCGDTLVAAHFGLRAGEILHWWFPVYAPEAADLSPGWMLLRELVTAAPDMGVATIDLGRGEDEYKRRAMTGQTMVGEGAVSRSAVLAATFNARRRARAAVASTGLAPRVRQALRRTDGKGAR